MFTAAAASTAATLPVCCALACTRTPAHAYAPYYAYTAPAAAADNDNDNNKEREGEEEKEEEKEKEKKGEGEGRKKDLLTYICSRPRRHRQIIKLFCCLAVLFKEELEEDKNKDKK